MQSNGHSAHIGQDAVVQYPWHPLCGRSTRCVLIERRASGEIAQLELEPGIVTMVAAWKLDPVYCGAIKVGLPQVSLAALSDLHRLLMTCESRLLFANGNTVTQEDHDGIAAIARTSIGTRSKIETCAAPPARPRPRRRTPSKRDGGSAPCGSEGSGSAADRGERCRDGGGGR
jgi:hypothetical protein